MIPFSLRAAFYILFAVVAVLTCAPLATLLERLGASSSHWPLLWDAQTLGALKITLLATACSLALALVVAIPAAWFLCRSDMPYRGKLRRVFLFPYLIPPYLLAIAWMTLAIPTVGLLNRLIADDFLNIYSFGGLVWVYACAYFPILLAPLCTAMDAMDPSLEEAARVCGARPLRVFLSISLPCAAPVIAASSLLFALDVMSAFGIPALIGNPARLYLLTTNIYSHAKMGGLQGTNDAFLVSVWLLFFAVAFIFLNEWITRRFAARLTGGKAPRQSLMPLGRWRWSIFGLHLALVGIMVVLPLAAVVLCSFLRIEGDLSFSNLTFDNYVYLFQMAELQRALVNSLVLGTLTAAICVVIGFFIAYFSDRAPIKGRKVLNRMATIPFAIPGTVIALALIVSFGTGWGQPEIALLGSPLLLLIAYVLKYLALSVQSLTPAVARIDVSLDEAARVSGAGPWRMLRTILFPLMAPALTGIFLLTMLPVFSELTMSVLLVGPGIETVGTVLFQLQEYANRSAACSLAALIIVALVILLPLFRRIAKEKLQ